MKINYSDFDFNASRFSIYKASEGGLGQRQGMLHLKEAGIPCVKDYSPFVGQTGIRVLSRSKRVLARATRILYGA